MTELEQCKTELEKCKTELEKYKAPFKTKDGKYKFPGEKVYIESVRANSFRTKADGTVERMPDGRVIYKWGPGVEVHNINVSIVTDSDDFIDLKECFSSHEEALKQSQITADNQNKRDLEWEQTNG